MVHSNNYILFVAQGVWSSTRDFRQPTCKIWYVYLMVNMTSLKWNSQGFTVHRSPSKIQGVIQWVLKVTDRVDMLRKVVARLSMMVKLWSRNTDKCTLHCPPSTNNFKCSHWCAVDTCRYISQLSVQISQSRNH